MTLSASGAYNDFFHLDFMHVFSPTTSTNMCLRWMQGERNHDAYHCGGRHYTSCFLKGDISVNIVRRN